LRHRTDQPRRLENNVCASWDVMNILNLGGATDRGRRGAMRTSVNVYHLTVLFGARAETANFPGRTYRSDVVIIDPAIGPRLIRIAIVVKYYIEGHVWLAFAP